METIDKLILLHTQQLKVLNKLKQKIDKETLTHDDKTLKQHIKIINEINNIYKKNNIN